MLQQNEREALLKWSSPKQCFQKGPAILNMIAEALIESLEAGFWVSVVLPPNRTELENRVVRVGDHPETAV